MNIQNLTLGNLGIIISAAAALLGLASLLFSWRVAAKNKEHKNLLESLTEQNECIEESLVKNKEMIEAANRRTTDQANRIAWLESRIRQPKLMKEEVIAAAKPAPDSLKLSITERRHRVLTMLSLGQSAETIAATLGMMPGEVDLIINLNYASLARN